MDPLRPFADAIRTLWKARRPADSARTGTDATAARERSPAPRTGETLRSRLEARINGLGVADVDKLRDRFVETVLLWEFGDQLAPDPAFAEIVARVSEQLASQPAIGERLHALLVQIAEKR